MIAIKHPDRFSIVTIAGSEKRAPAWEAMFGWPVTGRVTLPLAATTAGERNRWAARLDTAVKEADRAVLLVAEGVGCAASAWWARLSPADYVSRIAGALLFAPADSDAAQADSGLFASPRIPLPFPSLVIQPGQAAMSALDPMVHDWGSRLVRSGRERQRQPGSVAWRQAQRLFLRLTEQVVAHDVDRAHALAGSPRRG